MKLRLANMNVAICTVQTKRHDGLWVLRIRAVRDCERHLLHIRIGFERAIKSCPLRIIAERSRLRLVHEVTVQIEQRAADTEKASYRLEEGKVEPQREGEDENESGRKERVVGEDVVGDIHGQREWREPQGWRRR